MRTAALLGLILGALAACDSVETYPGGPGGGGGGGGGGSGSHADARLDGDAAEEGRVVFLPCVREGLANDAACTTWPTTDAFDVSIADLELTASGRFTVPAATAPRVLILKPTLETHAPTSIIVPAGDGQLDVPVVSAATLADARAASGLGLEGSGTVVGRVTNAEGEILGAYGVVVDGQDPVYPSDDPDTFVPGVGTDASGTVVWFGLTAPGAPTVGAFDGTGEGSSLCAALEDGVTFVDVFLE